MWCGTFIGNIFLLNTNKFIVKRRKVEDETVSESLRPNKNDDDSVRASAVSSV